MTAEGADDTKDEPRPAAALQRPTPDEDERLRGLIRAELDRQHAMPLARRTLELLAEAEIEPSRAEPGYRVIDRNGETRLVRDSDADPEEGRDVTSPMTLRGLVAELREHHPDLFATPPEPEEVDLVPPPPPEPEHDTLADVKAAGARFVESQSALAKSLAASSAEQGRSLAAAASGRFEGWRRQFGERFKRKPAPSPSAVGGVDDPTLSAPPPLPEAGTASGSRVADLARRGREAFPRLDRDAFDLHRVSFIGLAIATVLVIGFAATTALRRQPASEQPLAETPPATTTEPKPIPAETPKTEAKTETAPPGSTAKPLSPEPALEDAEAAPVDEPPRRNPDDLVGVPQVIDTATLKVAGKVVHLFGVEWVRGGQADELTKYIRGRSITCRPASGSSAFVCSIEGRDLSEVVLFNGGGRASSEASPDLVAAEDHARTERLGVWKR